MSNVYFISDTHFGHKNILEYEKEHRPFSSVEEMNETIIDRWNSVVHDIDVVFHLGDFAFGRSNIAIAERLKGKKKLILGNHDLYPVTDYLAYFEKIMGMVYWKSCVLSHMPIHTSGLGSRCFLNVHGHLHSKRVKRTIGMMMDVPDDNGKIVTISTPLCEDYDPNYFNVSCEQNNLTPIHADLIMQRLKEIEG